VTSSLRESQARHFDAHAPFTPVSRTLRASGFRYPYILKDELIARAISQLSPAPGDRVLDLGCGRGILLDRLATSFRTRGFGIDISRGTLRGLQTESLHSHQIACSEGENLPFRDNSFDLAVSLDVLEHVEAPEPVLAEMLRVLKPGGVLLCYAVSRKNGLTFNWFLTKALDILGVDHWAWNGHAPDRLVDPVRTRAYLEQSGCKVHYFRPFHSFFTILFDQSVLVLYWLAMRLRLRPAGWTPAWPCSGCSGSRVMRAAEPSAIRTDFESCSVITSSAPILATTSAESGDSRPTMPRTEPPLGARIRASVITAATRESGRLWNDALPRSTVNCTPSALRSTRTVLLLSTSTRPPPGRAPSAAGLRWRSAPCIWTRARFTAG